MSGVLPAVWVNGERQTSERAHVSADDRGLTLGDGLFETVRVERGKPFRLDRHMSRLTAGLAQLEIAVPAPLDRWIADALGAAASLPAAALRVTVTRGPGPAGVAPPPESTPTTIVALQPFPAFPAAIYERGLTAHVASGRKNERAMTAGIKTLDYADAVAAVIEAQRAGADDALFLDTEGHCAEAAASNLFVVARGTLATPPVSCGALPGVTRAAVMELARALDVSAAERPVSLDDLLGAEEAFLTSSLRGIAPLVRVGGRAIGRGVPGAVTHALREQYAALVARECGG